LFGHEKGAYTDAVSSRRGRFEIADGGTLFLDEIGDMSLSAQAKVLRVIQDQKMERLGGEKTIETDVRLIAATNKNLEEAYKQGRFREDLYFRLNVIQIYIPPLRERPGDIPLLINHFFKELGAENLRLEKDALELLMSHDWPGNVRELRNIAERMSVMHIGDSINAQALADLLSNNGNAKKAAPALPGNLMEQNFNDAKKSFEKYYLEFQFLKNNCIISKTADAIGVYQSNLSTKLNKFGIAAQKIRERK